jgi:hypothetical protein
LAVDGAPCVGLLPLVIAMTEDEAKRLAMTHARALGIALGPYIGARFIPFSSKRGTPLPEVNTQNAVWWIMYEHASAVQMRVGAIDRRDLLPVRVDILVSPSSSAAMFGDEV